MGPPGERGEAGEVGEKGPAGLVGDTGPPGETGLSGDNVHCHAELRCWSIITGIPMSYRGSKVRKACQDGRGRLETRLVVECHKTEESSSPLLSMLQGDAGQQGPLGGDGIPGLHVCLGFHLWASWPLT